MEVPILQAQGLGYSYYGGDQALGNVDLDIYEGERIVLLGPNGAGKSTFFLNLNGVLSPGEGKIFYRGREVGKKDLNQLRKKVGIVFQDPDSQIIASTVGAEVSFGPMNLKLSRAEVAGRVEEALGYMSLGDLRERPPHYLSGGEKKRVTIADILAMKPEVIIFDEPMASLDQVNRRMLEDTLEKLSNEGKTILVSTHDMDFAYQWAGRVVVFSHGTILADGKPQEVFQDEWVVKEAHLRRPTILKVWDLLDEKGLVHPGQGLPRDVEGLRQLLNLA